MLLLRPPDLRADDRAAGKESRGGRMGRSGERDGDGLGGTPLPGTPFPSGVLWERGGRAPEGAVEGLELSLWTIPGLSDNSLADSRYSIVFWLEIP